ncbi:MAG TPA: CHAD domain-containing protein [Phycisphaerales bacterium]|nr:CHAD domain-containing protein [Phycisphaerales bacterium]
MSKRAPKTSRKSPRRDLPAALGSGSGVGPSTPAGAAAEVIIRQRIEALARHWGRARRALKNGEDTARQVHQLRVACRRCAAALSAFRPELARSRRKALESITRDVRRSAGRQRERDVLVESLKAWNKDAAPAERKIYADLIRRAQRGGRGWKSRLVEALAKDQQQELAGLVDGLFSRKGKDKPASTPTERTFDELARARVRKRMERLDRSVANGTATDEQVHDLRLAIKKFRYEIEVYGPCLDAGLWKRSLGELAHLQQVMGEFNDQAMVRAFVEAAVGGAKSGEKSRAADRLLAKHRLRTDGLRARAVDAWHAFERGETWRDLRAWARGPGAPADEPADDKARAGGFVETKPVVSGKDKPRGSHRTAPAASIAPSANGTHSVRRNGKVRLAAIDVGSNSLRLIIAEASSDGSYRVLDDEKETTRLGRGLQTTGKMDPAAIEHSAVTIERMASIARGYGAEEVRVIATAAAREAKNGAALVQAVKDRTGLDVRIISAEEEAQLAYRSAARAFDLSMVPAIVVDIGGGSTEVILSVARPGVGQAGGRNGSAAAGIAPGGAAGGVVERIYTIPMGAVRLTEKFGGEKSACGARFKDLTAFVKKLVRSHVGKPPVAPQLAIGTGGTLTSLASMVLQRSSGGNGNGGGLFAGTVQGTEVNRADLRHLIDALRKMTLRQRMRVPGLSAERADIIVSGLVMIDAVLKRIGVNSLRTHEGGIRDGVMLTMVAERFGIGDRAVGERWTPEAIMRSVRRFARACSYERAHSEHVARLALSLFDQSRRAEPPDSGAFSDRERLLLEAAAVLHDIGYIINYAQHHKHSFHLIVHADLPGLTTREVQIIANIARYHRAACPKVSHAGYAALSRDDRRIVDRLSALMRIADGLDRSHTQQVRGVSMDRTARGVHIRVASDTEPTVDIWGAQRKSDLFTRCFGHEARFEWVRTEAPAAARDPGDGQTPSRRMGSLG